MSSRGELTRNGILLYSWMRILNSFLNTWNDTIVGEEINKIPCMLNFMTCIHGRQGFGPQFLQHRIRVGGIPITVAGGDHEVE